MCINIRQIDTAVSRPGWCNNHHIRNYGQGHFDKTGRRVYKMLGSSCATSFFILLLVGGDTQFPRSRCRFKKDLFPAVMSASPPSFITGIIMWRDNLFAPRTTTNKKISPVVCASKDPRPTAQPQQGDSHKKERGNAFSGWLGHWKISAWHTGWHFNVLTRISACQAHPPPNTWVLLCCIIGAAPYKTSNYLQLSVVRSWYKVGTELHSWVRSWYEVQKTNNY